MVIKRLLETSLDEEGRTVFAYEGKNIPYDELVLLLRKECCSKIRGDNGGALVYFSKEDYEDLRDAIDLK